MLPLQLTDALKALSVAQGGTLFSTTLAACMVLLRLYTGRSDIAVGSPLAGRNRGDIEGLIGLFVNPVVFRVQANVDLRFTEFMAVVRDAVWEALANQDVPFERVLEERRRRGEHNADPFYTINFICQTQYARASTLVHEFCGIRLSTMPSKSQGALYDLNLFVVQREDGWRLSLEYNTDRYSEPTAQSMLANFRALLEEIVNNPECPLSKFKVAGVISRRLMPDGAPAATQRSPATTTAIASNTDLQSAVEETYVLPASLAQKRFWLLAKVAMDSSAYHMPACVEISGPLSYAVLEASIQNLLDRHEILRTTFEEVDGELSQIVAASKTFKLEVSDVKPEAGVARDSQITELLRGEAQLPFDLSRGPLFRVKLFHIGANEHILIVTLHHIIADGWSQNIVQRELWSFYEILSDNREEALSSLAI